MTKETKIGLLVGLTFIILFAIILSEKGAPPRDTHSPVFGVADADRSGAAGERGVAMDDAGRMREVERALQPEVEVGPGGVPPAVGTDATERIAAGSDSAPGSPLPSLPESFVRSWNEGLTDDGATAPPPAADQPIDTTAVALDSGRGAGGPAGPAFVLPPPEDDAGDAAESSDGRHAAREPTVAADTTARPSPRAATIRTEHTVQSGESLGKIAARYYGRSTPQRVDALFEANRDALKSVHSVRAGQVVKIPDLPTDDPRFEAVTSLSPRGSATNASTDTLVIPPAVDRVTGDREIYRDDPRATTVATRIYEIKTDDSLWSIAKRELGEGARYKEILQLNRDRIANVHQLKPGTKIRLPQPAEADRSVGLHTVSTGELDVP